MWRALFAFSLVILLSACISGQSRDHFTMQQPEGYVSNSSVRTNNISWSNARSVSVKFEDYAYGPFGLTFEAAIPYRLLLRNEGSFFQKCASNRFFGAIAIRKIITDSSSIEYPFVHLIDITPGETTELQFVPVRRGTYTLHCADPLHRSTEMEGTITVR